jgi:hypothetical protein
MNSVINPSIALDVHNRVLANGQPSREGYFLGGIYAAEDPEGYKQLSDCYSRIRLQDEEVVESEFSDHTQRLRFLRKIRRLHDQGET